MNIQQKLEKLLDLYIEQNKKIESEYLEKSNLKNLYEELLSILNIENNDNYDNIKQNNTMVSILLNNIYKTDIYYDELYRILLNIEYDKESKKELKKFIKKLINELKDLTEEIETLKLQIERTKFLVSSAKRVRINFKYKTPIKKSKYDFYNIKKIISHFEMIGVISNKEELLLLNELETYNRRVGNIKISETEKNYLDDIYNQVPNILSIGFQEHDVIEVDNDRKNQLDKFVKEILSVLPNIKEETQKEQEEIISYIEEYKKYNLFDNEYNYIITKILDNYVDELFTFYELLIDKEIYSSRTERLEVVKNYYSILDKYLVVRKYYEDINTPSLEEETDLFEENLEESQNLENLNSEELSETKILIYSPNQANITKARILSDLEDVPYEYYETVEDLIKKFKTESLSKKEIKPLATNSTSKGYIELRRDQVRIILKHVKNNIYCVVKLFVKKEDTGRYEYLKIPNRIIPDISTEEKMTKHLKLAKITEEELSNQIKNKSRKGTR